MDTTPDFVKALDIDHARDGEVMLAYGMNGEDLPLLNGFPLRLIVPGYYGTYWVKHLNEITVIDSVFDGFWMKTAYRIPDTPCACVDPGTAPKATIPINRFNVRSFITSVADGAKLKPGATDAEGYRLRRRQGHQGSRGLDRRRQELDGGEARQGSRQIFVPRMEAAGEAFRRRSRTQGSRHQQCGRHPAERAAVESRRLSCATSSKPFASPRHEENCHDPLLAARVLPLAAAAMTVSVSSPRPRSPTSCPRKPRPSSPGPISNGTEQLHRLPFRRLHPDPAARAEIQEGFLASRGDQDDQGLRGADRRGRRAEDRRLPRRDLLATAGCWQPGRLHGAP